MNAPFASSIPAAADPLWQALSAYEVGPVDAELTFTQRLARENGWSLRRAARVFEEYRRFLYLSVTAPHPVTPSDAVDQAWHLHLAYTRDYWERLCPEVLGRALHHGPTSGGRTEGERFFEQYALTLRSYEAAFGPAPEDVWPDARRRFVVDPLAYRVHPYQALVLSWRALGVIAFLILLGFLLWRLL
jgi:hypothetical protein